MLSGLSNHNQDFETLNMFSHSLSWRSPKAHSFVVTYLHRTSLCKLLLPVEIKTLITKFSEYLALFDIYLKKFFVSTINESTIQTIYVKNKPSSGYVSYSILSSVSINRNETFKINIIKLNWLCFGVIKIKNKNNIFEVFLLIKFSFYALQTIN